MILPYVYKLTHRETGEFYIGFRKSNKIRSELDLGFKYFSSSKQVKKLGFENFNIEIIAEFFEASDAYKFEQELIKENFNDPLILNKNYNDTGNVKFINCKSMLGKKHSVNTKNKMRSAALNNSELGITSGKNHWNYGNSLSEETRKKIADKNRIIQKGKKKTQETKKKMSEMRSGDKHWNYGKNHSDSAKQKMAIAKLGKRGNRKKLYFQDDIKIFSYFMSGMTINEIHEKFYRPIINIEVIYSTIRNFKKSLKNIGINIQYDPYLKFKTFNNEEELEIIKLHLSGLSMNNILNKYPNRCKSVKPISNIIKRFKNNTFITI